MVGLCLGRWVPKGALTWSRSESPGTHCGGTQGAVVTPTEPRGNQNVESQVNSHPMQTRLGLHILC